MLTFAPIKEEGNSFTAFTGRGILAQDTNLHKPYAENVTQYPNSTFQSQNLDIPTNKNPKFKKTCL